MKKQHLEYLDRATWPLCTHLTGNEQIRFSSGSNGPIHPVAVSKAGHPLGWIERTLLAVDTNRVFIEASDPHLREELAAEYEAENRDVVAAGDSQTLLEFMEQLPIPTEPANDVVIMQDDFPKSSATDLCRKLKARGWSIPVYTVWNQSPRGGSGVTS
jgi:CheY-like chemotaxis protein